MENEAIQLDKDELIKMILSGEMPTLDIDTPLGAFTVKAPTAQERLGFAGRRRELLAKLGVDKNDMTIDEFALYTQMAELEGCIVSKPKAVSDIGKLPLAVLGLLYRRWLHLDTEVASLLQFGEPASVAERAGFAGPDGAAGLAGLAEPERRVFASEH